MTPPAATSRAETVIPARKELTPASVSSVRASAR
jgi:hypothetical protein